MKNNGHIHHENPTVEYWMNRALKAERDLKEHQIQTIKSAGFEPSYKNLLQRIFG